MIMEYSQPLMRYTHTNNSLLSSGNTKKSTTTYEPRTEAISPAINDDILNAEDSTSKSTKDEQTLIVEKLKKVEAEILQTDLQIVRLRRQKEQLEQAASSANKDNDDQENVFDTKQLSIAKLVYHENRAKAQRAHSKLDCLGGFIRDLPIYNQPTDNAIYHHNTVKFNQAFKTSLVNCFRNRLNNRLKLEESVSAEYDRRMEKWLKSIEIEDSQPSKRIKDAKAREFFEKQFPELKKARESGERFSRVGQRVARSDAEVAELMDGITEREDQDKKVKSYAVIPPMLEEMRSRKPKFINTNGYVEDIIAEYKEYQILNTWTDEEKDIFRENYLQHPKDFGLISRMTTRKNVANCVHYYYLSKKSENYKQLLKRQQKRRTRSFVRPAQATPANTTSSEPNNDKGANGNDKQTGDSTTTDTAGSELNDGTKPKVLSGDMGEDGVHAMDHDGAGDQPSPRCCICDCNFSETNQFRNVTRSNHQIYGIGIELLKPGLKICYSCRFRHVKHPSFDEPSNNPEPMDEGSSEPIITEVPEADLSTSKCDMKCPPNCNQPPNSQRMSPPQMETSPHQASLSNDQSGCPDGGDTHKNTKRTCVRDIIYQAIEMSFQKQEPNSEIQSKSGTVRPEVPPLPTTNPLLPQPPFPSISGPPVYGLPPHQAARYRPIQPPPRHIFMEDSSQFRPQQFHIQNMPLQQHQPQQPPQQQQQQIHQQRLKQQHLRPLPPLMHRPLNPPMSMSPQQPTGAPVAHPLNLCRKYNDPVAHPLNLCRKYSDPMPGKDPSPKLEKTSPPVPPAPTSAPAQPQPQPSPLQQQPQPPLQQQQQQSAPPTTVTPTSTQPSAPARQEASPERSRSPNLTGSPTSPKEMVIDESADEEGETK